jgi:hypothetical protein
MLTLTVVNRMLATLGEAPLNALTDPHTFRGSALAKLDGKDAALQTKGWWFNRELLTLSPNIGDSKIYLPGDVINVMVPNRLDIVQRGRVLYDTVNGTNLFTESVDAQIIRRVPFEELPELVAEYIAAEAVLEFQSDFDSDNNKRQLLVATFNMAKLEFNAEATRQARYNVIDSNDRLQRLKSRINYARKV